MNRKGDGFQAAIYFAVGAFTSEQRANRSAQLLKAARKGDPPAAPATQGPRVIVVGPEIDTASLIAGVREIAHKGTDVSLHVEVFKSGWPGNDARGRPTDARTAFLKWLSSADGKAHFGTACAVTLYAVDMALVPPTG